MGTPGSPGGADFKAGFLNATALKKNFCRLRQVLLDHPTTHLFGIAKARLDESVDSSLVGIQGYSVMRQDSNRGGSGILLYIYNKLKTKVL